MAVNEQDKCVLTITSGSLAWKQVNKALESHLGAWHEYEYAEMVEWFKSQKATYTPLADSVLSYYSLEFDTQEDLMEFMLTWL